MALSVPMRFGSSSNVGESFTLFPRGVRLLWTRGVFAVGKKRLESKSDKAFSLRFLDLEAMGSLVSSVLDNPAATFGLPLVPLNNVGEVVVALPDTGALPVFRSTREQLVGVADRFTGTI